MVCHLVLPQLICQSVLVLLENSPSKEGRSKASGTQTDIGRYSTKISNLKAESQVGFDSWEANKKLPSTPDLRLGIDKAVLCNTKGPCKSYCATCKRKCRVLTYIGFTHDRALLLTSRDIQACEVMRFNILFQAKVA